MFEVSIKSHFSAAHHLKGYAGACAAFHGHNWEIEVFLRGCDLDDTGILVDFRDLKVAIGTVLDDIDHADLNEVEAFKEQNPTSENIARFLYGELSSKLNCDRYNITKISVHETPGTTASYWE
jgi:6-pyruvoyltetrahydropterin/6-carboxytetrahydropterin synthase